MDTDELLEEIGQEDDETDPKSPTTDDKIPKEILLVTLIGQEEPLFNHKHEDYRNCLRKDNLWREIAEKVGWSVPHCKSKWKAMRDQYCRELKRCRTLPNWTIRWKYFQHMDFLRPHALHRKCFLVPSSYRPKKNNNTDNSQQESNSQDDEMSRMHSELKKELESWKRTSGETKEENSGGIGAEDDEDDDPIRTFLNIESYFESELIKLIKAEEILYNHKKRAYRNVKLKQEIWEDIAQKLNRTVSNCRGKWKALRDQYIREYKRLQKYSMCKNLKPWKHYESLSFLEPFFRQKTENGKLVNLFKHAPNISSEDDQDEMITETIGEDPSSSLFISVADNDHSKSRYLSENQETTLQNSIDTSYSGQCDDEHSIVEEDTMCEFPKEDATKETDDEVGVFFRAVAMKIRNAKMSSTAFTDLQIDILQVISKALRD